MRPKLPLFIGLLLLTGCTVASPSGNQASSDSSSSLTACTMEAKICPDGSAVGRQEPNCAFAACPVTSSGATLQSVSDHTITISYPATFEVATLQSQVQGLSYIPPCESGFSYCFHYTGTAYAGTNFEAAGVGITKRTDLVGTDDCLNANPSGYSNQTPVLHIGSGYTTGFYGPLSDAATGHYANDRLYRLSVNNSCYEIRERIGQTQFANFPKGTIIKFTPADEQALQTSLDDVLHSITILNGQSVVWPVVTDK